MEKKAALAQIVLAPIVIVRVNVILHVLATSVNVLIAATAVAAKTFTDRPKFGSICTFIV